jgi:hypothetical protein
VVGARREEGAAVNNPPASQKVGAVFFPAIVRFAKMRRRFAQNEARFWEKSKPKTKK